MMRHLDAARLELRRALEEHDCSGELDKLTRLILEAVTAPVAARRELFIRQAEQPPAAPRARDCPEQFTEGAA